MHRISRRAAIKLVAAIGLGLPALADALPPESSAKRSDAAPAPALRDLIRNPLLVHSLYRVSVSRTFSPDGAAGANREGYQWIEEQRQGTEWIVRGYASGKDDWMRLGWRQLDWGLAQQQADGGFGSKDAFHSTSFFVEALARACLIDPAGATNARIDGLTRGARWLMRPDIELKGAQHNLPYTHRRYILAAAFGQTAALAGEPEFARRAATWAQEGLALQQDDGTNPEKGGYDVGYQMVGVLMSLRYLPACPDGGLRARLRAMIRKAVAPELALEKYGVIEAGDSTRIGKERARSGQIKDVPYGEILQALVYGAMTLPQAEWMEPARRIALARNWLKE